MENFSFRRWLQEDTQVTELQVARFLEDVFSKAAALKKQDMQKGNNQFFTAYIHQVWPPEAIQNKNFVLPNIFPSDIAGRPVQFKLKQAKNHGDTVHDNGRFEGFVFNILPFNVAKTPEEIDQHLESIKTTIHHEVEHIYNVGAEYDADNWQGDDKQRMSMQYMNNPGEKRAHARQMAYSYSKHFPGEPFDLRKAQSIAGSPALNNTHVNYFTRLANPEVWQQNVQKFGYNHPNPHDEIANLTKQFLTQY